jgi:hypothetical protein
VTNSLQELSPRAMKLLDDNSSRRAVPSKEEVREYFKQRGCPEIPLFVDFLCRFSGLRFQSYSKTHGDVLCLSSLGHPDLLRYYPQFGRWEMFVGCWENAIVNLVMHEDGAIRVYHGNYNWSRIVATSIRSYLEMEAICKEDAEKDWIRDWIVVSDRDVASTLASYFGLRPDAYLFDDTIEWWIGERMNVGIHPGGYSIPAMRLDYILNVAWQREIGGLDETITSILFGMVDPWNQMQRIHPQFKECRDSGRPEAVPGSSTYRPAHSFRKAALIGLGKNGYIENVEDLDLKSDGLQEVFSNSYRIAHSMSCNDGLYYASVGLATFGQATALIDVVEKMPIGSKANWSCPLWSAQHLGYFVPIPHCPVEKPKESLEWIRANAINLSWHDELLYYFSKSPDQNGQPK